MRKILKKLLFVLSSIFLLAIIWTFTTSTVKNVQKTILVEEFKDKGVFQKELSTEKIKFYKIESNEKKEAFISYDGIIYPGTVGDIIVSTNNKLVNPVIGGLLSYTVGGHACLVTKDYEDYQIDLDDDTCIEAIGLNENNNVASVFPRDFWDNHPVYREVIGLRVKMSDEEIDELISYASTLVGDPYNYSFLFNTDESSYCTDIISKSFKKIGYNLNKDSFATTVYDLIVSSDTYISYYHYFDSEGVKHIYYLG